MKIVKTNAKKPLNTTIDELLVEIREAQVARIEADNRERLAKDKIKEIMFEHQMKTVETRSGDKVLVATVVTPEPVPTIDHIRLLETLELDELSRVTKRVIDNQLLEEEMDRNADFIKKVQPFVTFKERNPYMRFTEKVAKDDE